MWSKDDITRIATMNELFGEIFGDDFLPYKWDKVQRMVSIPPESYPCYEYDHALWEEDWLSGISNRSQ